VDARQERGRQIAASAKITKPDRGTWIVPSQSDKGRYAVTIYKEGKFCTCPDFELRPQPCKHVYAVQYVLFRMNQCQAADPNDESTGAEFGRAPARRFDGVARSLPTPPRA
jgi:hypothetical protein